jgi:hypothetical protein
MTHTQHRQQQQQVYTVVVETGWKKKAIIGGLLTLKTEAMRLRLRPTLPANNFSSPVLAHRLFILCYI